MADLLDLNAALREAINPDGIEMPYGPIVFRLPAELPLDVFDPFLADDFDLVGLVREFVVADKEGKDIAETLVEVLMARPNLPQAVLGAFYGSLRLLFGAEEFAQFQAQRPGLKTYTILIRLLLQKYGVGLGEAFGSAKQSESDGETSKQTSPAATPSTPEASSADQEPETDSSESDDSATS